MVAEEGRAHRNPAFHTPARAHPRLPVNPTSTVGAETDTGPQTTRPPSFLDDGAAPSTQQRQTGLLNENGEVTQR